MEPSLSTLYWHDYETWGEVPAQDRPSQFAGVRTDEDLNIVGEPLMIYCQPPPDLLPKPDACMITGFTPRLAQQKGLPEVTFAAKIHAELAFPGTCGVGFNSIRFDDEVTRYLLYRNFYDPYEREWRNGNSRWDIIDVVRMTRALRPEGIIWPNYEDGRPCFKLEALTRANNLQHDAAHDALSDVYATIAVARLIKTTHPKLYDYAFKLRDKRFVGSLIDISGCKPLLHISSRFSAENGNAALVLPIAVHPINKNSVITFNLSFSPADLLALSVDELRVRLYTATDALPDGVTRLALKEIHLNKSPMVLPVTMLDDATAVRLSIDRQVCERHWQQFRSLTLDEQRTLQAKLVQLYSDNPFAEKTDPEQMLYNGFVGDHDKKLMLQLRRAQPERLASGQFEFQDGRLHELLFRYRARNFPEALNEEEEQRWRHFCYMRLTDPGYGAGICIGQLQERITELLQMETTTEQQKIILKELLEYADNHVNTYVTG